jgi:hypothetical protein
MFRITGRVGRGSGRGSGSMGGSRHVVDSFLLNVSVVQLLGGAVVDSLHKSFQEMVFILGNTSRPVEFGEDVVYGFKE